MTELWTNGYVWVVCNMWCYLLRGDSMCLNYKARLQPFMTYCSGAPCADMEPKHLIPSLSLVVLHLQWLEFQKKTQKQAETTVPCFFSTSTVEIRGSSIFISRFWSTTARNTIYYMHQNLARGYIPRSTIETSTHQPGYPLVIQHGLLHNITMQFDHVFSELNLHLPSGNLT